MFIINVGSRDGRGLHSVPKPVVTFYQAIETFFRYLPGNKFFFLRTDKKNKKQKNKKKQKNSRNIYIYMIYIYMIYIFM